MKRNVLLLFILALVMLVIVGWLGRNAINRSIRTVEEASAPNQKLLLIREVFQDLLDAESSVRTYTITEERNALDVFGDAAVNVDSKLNQLNTLTVDAGQRQLLVSMDSLIERKFETLKRLIQIKDAGSDSSVLDKIRTDIETLRQQDASEQLSAIKDLYLDEENTEQDYQRLFGDVKEQDSSAANNTEQDLSSKQLEELLTRLSRQETAENQARLREELDLTSYDNQLMNEIRTVVKQFETNEALIAQDRTESVTEASQNAKSFITTIMISGLILFAIMLLVIFNDISKNIRNRKALKAAKEEAERLAKVKEEFLSNMSHEIRTPLNAVIGFTEQLSGSALNTDQTTYVERIQRSGQHLRQLINDILDYAKLESGKVSLENVGFQPVQHVRDVVALLEKKAADKDLYIKMETATDIPEVLIGDPVRLNQVIINLVDNALKFTKKGGVSINLSTAKSSESNILLKISITDTGIGIPADKIETIFEDFAQADSSTTREFGGTGLGLSIVRKIIDTMNGQLDVQSEEDKGTTFTVSLPFSKGTRDDLPLNRIEKKSVDFSGRSILIVDDQSFNVELAETILSRTGATVQSCQNGLEALEKLDHDRFDIVLMDIQMPEMSGLEATKQLRNSEGINKDTRIIALTAGSSEQDKTTAIEAGMNDILLKPFTQDDLLKIISDHLEDTDTDHETNAPDLTDLASLSDGDDSFVIHMLDIFIGNSEKDLRALTDCDDDDFSRIKAIAHKMIPPCRHLGLEKTVNTLKEIEESAELENSSAIAGLIDRLAREFQTIHPAIEEELRNLRTGKARSSA